MPGSCAAAAGLKTASASPKPRSQGSCMQASYAALTACTAPAARLNVNLPQLTGWPTLTCAAACTGREPSMPCPVTPCEGFMLRALQQRQHAPTSNEEDLQVSCIICEKMQAPEAHPALCSCGRQLRHAAPMRSSACRPPWPALRRRAWLPPAACPAAARTPSFAARLLAAGPPPGPP